MLECFAAAEEGSIRWVCVADVVVTHNGYTTCCHVRHKRRKHGWLWLSLVVVVVYAELRESGQARPFRSSSLTMLIIPTYHRIHALLHRTSEGEASFSSLKRRVTFPHDMALVAGKTTPTNFKHENGIVLTGFTPPLTSAMPPSYLHPLFTGNGGGNPPDPKEREFCL